MPGDELITLIDQAVAEGWTELDLSGRELTELPTEIGKLTNLKMLSLSGNQITELPSTISQQGNLEGLYADKNQITEIPSSIIQLSY